jgi:hypothetical protein
VLFPLTLAIAAGCSRGPDLVSESGAVASGASLAALGGGFAVAWSDTRDGNAEIYMRLLDAQGRAAAPERRLTNDADASVDADLVPLEGAVAVAWTARKGSADAQPQLGVWTSEGRERWRIPIARAGRNAIVRAGRRGLFCAWIEDEAGGAASVRGGWWTLDGKPLVEAQRLAPAGRTTSILNAAVDRYDTAWVVFAAAAGTRSEELFLVRGGSPPVRLTDDDGVPSKGGDVALSGSLAAFTWSDERDGNPEVYLAVIADGDLTRFQPRARRLTMTGGASIAPALAWNGPLLGVAWSDASDGQPDVYAQIFSTAGRELEPIARLTDTSAESMAPAIAPGGETFAIAWSESGIAFTMHP